MKIKTNAGEVELTAEMVCRGMVFTAADYHLGGGLFVVGRRDDANNVWRDAGDDGLGTNLLGAQRFLGCDPTVASRADCERFGVHGDAGAHGFARLRDGGAVDLRRVPVRGMVIERNGVREQPFGACRLPEGARFVGLNAEASEWYVRDLCCGDHQTEEILDGYRGRTATGNVCSIAIGDHDEHEDIAHGVKWKTSVARVDAAVKTVSAFNANLRGSAALLAGPSCGRCGKVTEPSAIGPMMLRLPVGDRYADAPVCQACLAEVNKDVGAWTIREGKIERKTEWPGLDIVSGKALDRLALLYDEERRAGETCEDLRARLRGVHGRRSRKDTGNGFRVGGTYVVGVDPARPGTEATAFVSAAMRKAGESLARVGEAAKWGAGRCPACNGILPVHEARCPLIGRAPAAIEWRHGSASLGQSQAHILRVGDVYRWQVSHLGLRIRDGVESRTFDAHAAAGRILFAVHEATPSIEWLAKFFGLLFRIHDSTPAAMRAKQEAPLVALVAAVPAGLDPIGWRAAVLAEVEGPGHLTSSEASEFGAQVEAAVRGRDVMAFPHASAAYQRAIAPAPKVDRVRATWKTRGPVLPVDDGRDE